MMISTTIDPPFPLIYWPSSASIFLVVGTSALNAPFGGGVMVPKPDFIVPIAQTCPPDQNALVFNSIWPTGVPPGTDVYFQVWFSLPNYPGIFTSSNALRVGAR